jgi:hypothetical protein
MVAMLQMPSMMIEETGAERRQFPRKEVHARVEGKRLDHDVNALRSPHLSLALRDLSFGGLSALSQMPLNKGERISVFFPPQGINRGWDAYGKVIRCEPSSFGYRVAVAFDPLPAA